MNSNHLPGLRYALSHYTRQVQLWWRARPKRKPLVTYGGPPDSVVPRKVYLVPSTRLNPVTHNLQAMMLGQPEAQARLRPLAMPMPSAGRRMLQ